MRPPVLNPLFAALPALPGIGPKLEKLYARLLGREDEPARIIDLLFHLPTGFVDRRQQPKLGEVVPETVVTVAVTVDRHRPPPSNRPRAPYNIDTSDDTNTLTITYFNARRDSVEKLFPEGETRYVSGVATLYDGHLQMVHPDRVVDAANFGRAGKMRLSVRTKPQPPSGQSRNRGQKAGQATRRGPGAGATRPGPAPRAQSSGGPRRCGGVGRNIL